MIYPRDGHSNAMPGSFSRLISLWTLLYTPFLRNSAGLSLHDIVSLQFESRIGSLSHRKSYLSSQMDWENRKFHFLTPYGFLRSTSARGSTRSGLTATACPDRQGPLPCWSSLTSSQRVRANLIFLIDGNSDFRGKFLSNPINTEQSPVGSKKITDQWPLAWIGSSKHNSFCRYLERNLLIVLQVPRLKIASLAHSDLANETDVVEINMPAHIISEIF